MSYNPPQQGAFEDPINAQQQQQQTQQALKDRRSICKKISDLDTKTVISYLRYANLCNAMCIITAGIVTVATLGSGSLNLTSMFIGLYISIFGCMLFCFECRLARMEVDVRRNFGFLYSYTGRTLFIVFIATICFGATGGSGDSSGVLGILCGTITFINAFFNCFVIYRHPAFTREGGIDRTADPGAMYTSGEVLAAQGAGEAARRNPDLAMKAGTAAIGYAATNPGARKQAVNYAMDNPDQARQMAGAYQGAPKNTSGGNDNPFG